MSLPDGVERDYPLAPLTTVRAGGDAELFARPTSRSELVELLRWAEAESDPVEVIGSGSNLLVADDGVRGLVLKLAGELTAIEREGERVVCGGGVRLPSAAAKVAGWGLGGLEFGINIPGTVGGAVRMNANAYGGQLARVLEWVDVCTRSGTERRNPRELGFAYRRSGLRPGEVVSRAAFALDGGRAGGGEGDPGRDAGDAPRGAAIGDQDLRLDVQEPRPRTTPAAAGRTAGSAARGGGLPGLGRRRGPLPPKHANFVENTGSATTADVLAVMAAGRRRVYERFGVELRARGAGARGRLWPEDWELDGA